jgi:hypothetical protein
MLKRAVLLCAALLIVASSSFAWGRAGHQVVANVAQERLSPAARKAIAALLKGATLASVSTEADDYRNMHPETERWHWVDIPITAGHYDATRDCQNVRGEGDCILAEIDRLVATLKDRSRPEVDRVQALKFLVHFVGDLHCPVHAGDNHDRGGNNTPVTFFGRPTNLHSVWDTRLIAQAGFTVTSLTEAVEKLGTRVKPGGTPVAWAEEAHDAARDVAYPIPADHVLGQAYLDAAMPALQLQLLRGGIRLAALLNAIFDGTQGR